MNDSISRQAAINIAKELIIPIEEYLQYNTGVNNYCAELMKLPITHSGVSGHWIVNSVGWTCSECGYRVFRFNNTPYCPNCGADMQ